MKDQDRGQLPSASYMPRIVGCPGFLNYRQEIGPLPEDESDDAKAGTVDHAILANDGAGADALDDRRRWVVFSALEARDAIVSELFKDSGVEILKEQRFWMLDADGTKMFSGMLDWVAIHRESFTALVIDWKTGSEEVEPSESNWQLLSQVTALVEHMKRHNSVYIRSAYAAVVQPLVSKTPVLVRYEDRQIEDANALIRRKLRESASTYAPRTPGEWCKYCPLNGHCPEAQSLSVMLHAGSAIERIPNLGPEQIVSMLPHFKTINKIMDAVKKRAEELAKAGLLPGYEMKPGYDLTDVTDIPGFYAAMVEECGVTKEEFFRNLNVVKGGLEELFRERWTIQTGGSKKAASARFDQLVEQFGTKTKTKDRLNPVKEKAQIA